MKNSIFVLIIFFRSVIYCQTQIDNNLSIQFPGKTEITNEKTQGFIAKSFFLNTTDDAFFAMKLEGITTKIPLPENKSNLKSYYQTLSRETVTNLKNKGYIKSSERLVSFKNYTAYQFEFSDSSTKEKSGDCLVLFVDRIAYLFIYVKIGAYSEKRKEAFFSSINVEQNLPQFEEKYNYFTAALKILFSILIIVLIRIYLKRDKRLKASS